MQRTGTVVAWVVGMAISGGSQAALQDRGGGLLYDDVLNVTWLQDANYAKTSGFDADGRMTWQAANEWAESLVYHDAVRNVDYDDWRLAVNTPVNGTDYVYSFTFDGSTDRAYNVTSEHAELAYMYYVNLGLKGWANTSGVGPQPDYGIFGNGTGSFGDQNDVGLVKNLQASYYWYAGEAGNDPTKAWTFHTDAGPQLTWLKTDLRYAWAVRTGDVAAVPEPATFASMAAGLGAMGLLAWRRRGDRGTQA